MARMTTPLRWATDNDFKKSGRPRRWGDGPGRARLWRWAGLLALGLTAVVVLLLSRADWGLPPSTNVVAATDPAAPRLAVVYSLESSDAFHIDNYR